MYSKNDYRYYLENQLVHSDEFFAHYGVKGMRWKHHKYTLADKAKNELDYMKALNNGETVYDPSKPNVLISGTSKKAKKNQTNKHAFESTSTRTNRDYQSGEYHIKKTGNSRVDEAALRNRGAKKQTYKRTADGVESRLPKTKSARESYDSNKKVLDKLEKERKARNRKKKAKQIISDIKNKDNWKREKPAGKRLKGTNIYVS